MSDDFIIEDNREELQSLMDRSYGAEKGVKVGVLDSSERDQFRLGGNQQFYEDTADLLLSAVDDEDELLEQLVEIGAAEILDGESGDDAFIKLGETVQEKMQASTDDPEWGGGSTRARPQLASAIKVELDK